MEKSIPKRAEDITEFIAGSRTYEEAIATIRVGYEDDQKIDKDGYTVRELLEVLQRFQTTSGKKEIQYVTRFEDMRWAVLTLEITTMIREADDIETVAERIQQRYSGEKLYSESLSNYSVDDVVKPLQNMEMYSHRNITSSCDMRQAVKELDSS